MTYDDRMEQENQRKLAESMFMQSAPAKGRGGSAALHEDDASGSDHPDAGFASKLFSDGVLDDLVPPPNAKPKLNLSALEAVESSSRRANRSLTEDLVKQAAQSLCKSEVDAFLAMTQRMSPEEILGALKIARDWRRPEDGWQDDFAAKPETGFKFVDRKKESLAANATKFMQTRKIAEGKTATIVLQVAKAMNLKINEAVAGEIVTSVKQRLRASRKRAG